MDLELPITNVPGQLRRAVGQCYLHVQPRVYWAGRWDMPGLRRWDVQGLAWLRLLHFMPGRHVFLAALPLPALRFDCPVIVCMP